jgi:phosphinothricin acetyltransferase
MKLPVQVRTATVTDLPLILEIVNHAILFSTAVYDYEPRSIEVQHSWFEKKQAEGMPVIVAEYDGKVIGFGSYGIFRPWAAYQFSVEHSVYVSESFRGQGVGGKLLEELIKLAIKQGFHTMIAGIDAANTNSYTFHKKYGFGEVGRFKEVGFKFNRWLDLVFMQRFL